MIKTVDFKPGDIVRVHQKIQEGEKARVQVFEGAVLSMKGTNGNRMFTVRKIVGDVAIERIFPIDSPSIEKVEIKGKIKEKVSRAKLYFLRKHF